MARHLIGNLSEIPEGEKKIVELERKSIGIYNIKGEFYAIRNLCPHQGAPLCSGMTTAFITSPESGQFIYEREGEIVRCPWHQWEFDIKTGCMVIDPKMRTKTYDITVEKYDVSINEGQLYVDL